MRAHVHMHMHDARAEHPSAPYRPSTTGYAVEVSKFFNVQSFVASLTSLNSATAPAPWKRRM
jgi:hypothetical protein